MESINQLIGSYFEKTHQVNENSRNQVNEHLSRLLRYSHEDVDSIQVAEDNKTISSEYNVKNKEEDDLSNFNQESQEQLKTMTQESEEVVT